MSESEAPSVESEDRAAIATAANGVISIATGTANVVSVGTRSIDPGPLARTPEEWAAAVQPMGGRAFHGKQVFRWIQARGVVDPEAMTDLPATLRAGPSRFGPRFGDDHHQRTSRARQYAQVACPNERRRDGRDGAPFPG